MQNNLILRVNHPQSASVFENVVRDMPAESSPYVFGGAMRGAACHYYHGRELPQRDYDQIITAESHSYISFLKDYGFILGGTAIGRRTVMGYGLAEGVDAQDYNKSVVFDMHAADGTDVMDFLRSKVGLTVCGIALPLRDVFRPDWITRVAALPSSLEGMRNKQLRVNPDGYKAQAANIFACLRLVALGFAPPEREELDMILQELPQLEEERFHRNVQKVYTNAGGEGPARSLVAELGIKGDIFTYDEVQAGAFALT